MKKMMNWVLAATLVCGTGVVTSCTTDSSDNPSEEQAKSNRKEFIQHTRATLKDLAENLNFRSWDAANELNIYFNQYVLNNPGFEKAVLATFMQKTQQSIKPVEEGSELAEMGYYSYGTVDLTDFNYRFTMNANNDGFDVEPADDFEVVLNGWNPATQQLGYGLYKLTLQSGGDKSFKFVHASRQQLGTAFVIVLPSEFQFAISANFNGQWKEHFSGSFKNQISVAEGHEYAQLNRDNLSISGTLRSCHPAMTELNLKADETKLDFSIVSDNVNKSGIVLSWSQNDRKMVDLELKDSGDGIGKIIDMSQFTSSSSILDVIGAIMTSRTLDEGKLTLLDDLTTTISISDMQGALQVAREGAAARRNYADQKTIDQYTQRLNELVKGEITCKGVNQEIPMRLMTTKFGVDYWTMPAFNFADENGYVSLVDLLDAESVQYSINIIDHAAGPMQQSIIVVRQLLQYLQGLVSGFQQPQGE